MGDVRISAKSTLTTLTRQIEVIAGNLVGASIYGFKGVRLSFSDTLVSLIRGGTGTTSQGGLNPIQVGTGGIGISATTTDYSQGSIMQTKNQGDLAIQGNAFFATVDAAGKITYTRSGEFHFDDQGNFVTNDGLYVLGVFDSSKDVIKSEQFKDTGIANARGITFLFYNGNSSTYGLNFTGTDPYGSKTATVTFYDILPGCGLTEASCGTIENFIDDATNDYIDDAAAGLRFVPGGVVGGKYYDSKLFKREIGTINGITITLEVAGNVNKATNTSFQNAKLIAAAINRVAENTGIGCSVIQNANDLEQAALVLCPVQRTLSSAIDRIPTSASGAALRDQLLNDRAGVLLYAKDSRGNLFHRINIKTLFGKSPGYLPEAGDLFHFDSTGQLINDSRGKDTSSAPPFSTGVRIAINKFSNANGLQKVRGSSQFQFTDAAGTIQIGYAGLDRAREIDGRFGREITGSSIIGAENLIVPQALESSNTSVTESLPELTIAQKTFTSNTKVINVGNSIVDDLNGLIR